MDGDRAGHHEVLVKALAESLRDVKRVLMVLSGKGGVGKSLVAASLAISLSLLGRRVAILDADFHGPSIPWILGVEDRYIGVTIDGRFIPVDVEGVAVMSIELMLRNRSSPVIWRGPLKVRTLIDLLSRTLWGSRDYLIVDLPPGTGDEPLTIVQYLKVKPLAGILILTPGSVVKHVVSKAMEFLNLLSIPLLGVVINMAYLRCPSCRSIVRPFGSVEMEGVEVLAEIPLDPELAEAVDRSDLLGFIKSGKSDVAEILRGLGPGIEQRLTEN